MKDLYGNDDIEGMYQQALRVPLADKEEIAIMTIRNYESMALARSPDGFYECFSGGKDSIVQDKLFELSGVKFTRNLNNTTIDPPELLRFVRKYYPDTIWHNPPQGNLPMYMKEKSCGPPTRLARWCCELYKEQGGRGLFKAFGVRAEESARRKGMWQTVTLHKSDLSPILSPILYWTEMDVWNFIKKYNLPYCSLYDEGFKRLGCIGCPMGGAKGMARDFARWPKYEKLWKRGFQAYWDKYKGTPTKRQVACPQCNGIGKTTLITDAEEVTITCLNCYGTGRIDGERWIEKFPDVESFWNWWISGKAYEGNKPDCQMFLW
jgi:phosphoadenosine phosphosulfate reductase